MSISQRAGRGCAGVPQSREGKQPEPRRREWLLLEALSYLGEALVKPNQSIPSHSACNDGSSKMVCGQAKPPESEQP